MVKKLEKSLAKPDLFFFYFVNILNESLWYIHKLEGAFSLTPEDCATF